MGSSEPESELERILNPSWVWKEGLDLFLNSLGILKFELIWGGDIFSGKKKIKHLKPVRLEQYTIITFTLAIWVLQWKSVLTLKSNGCHRNSVSGDTYGSASCNSVLTPEMDSEFLYGKQFWGYTQRAWPQPLNTYPVLTEMTMLRNVCVHKFWPVIHSQQLLYGALSPTPKWTKASTSRHSTEMGKASHSDFKPEAATRRMSGVKTKPMCCSYSENATGGC